jgi:hypothetical protein
MLIYIFLIIHYRKISDTFEDQKLVLSQNSFFLNLVAGLLFLNSVCTGLWQEIWSLCLYDQRPAKRPKLQYLFHSSKSHKLSFVSFEFLVCLLYIKYISIRPCMKAQELCYGTCLTPVENNFYKKNLKTKN